MRRRDLVELVLLALAAGMVLRAWLMPANVADWLRLAAFCG